jgi:autotransporter strand-loop-strand O-heptosyltransferase
MKFDFIEIGTSDFHTLIEQANDSTRGISIEPIKSYLDSLPDKPNVIKVNAAMSDKESFIDIYHVPAKIIYDKCLPIWLRGCNSVTKPHDYARTKLGPELYDSLVQVDKVPCITWKKLVEDHNITGIEFLKIDTEGHEAVILKDYFDSCSKDPRLYAKKIKFEYNETSDKVALDKIMDSLVLYDKEILDDDVILYRKENTGFYYKNIKLSDVAYIINLPERTDRREYVDEFLSDLGFRGYQFVDGIKFDNPEFKKMGCTQTYNKIFKEFLSSNHQNIIVLEDDLKLMDGVTQTDLDNIFSNWSETVSTYNVVALGVKLLPRSRVISRGKTHGSFEEMLCSQSLYYEREFIEHYISLMDNNFDPNHFLYKCTIDMFLNDCSSSQYRFRHHGSHKKFDFGITIPMVFTQTNSFSDNENFNQNYDKIMENAFWNSVFYDKAYVLYSNESYYKLVTMCCKSIREFSELPIFVYMLNSNLKVDVKNTHTIRWDCDITNKKYDLSGKENYYLDRTDPNIYELLIQRPLVVKDALERFARKVAYVDSDSIATYAVDRIFDFFDPESTHPYFVEGIYDYLRLNGRGGAEDRSDLSTTLEAPACDLLNVNQYVRERYRQTGYFVAGQKCIDFLDEWYWMCSHPKILKDFTYYAPYHEETIANVMLYKYNIKTGLPYLYVNGSSSTVDKMYTEVEYKGPHVRNHLGDWLRAPQDKNTLLFFHGEKRIDVMEEMIQKIKKYKEQEENKTLNVLFLAPHLSTGGMPGFLLKRLEVLKTYYPDINLYVVEHGFYGDAYVVQRNKIKELVGLSNFRSLGNEKMNLIKLIKDWKIDIVHVDEMIEGFDSFNKMPVELMNELYSNERSWKVIETCHNVWFKPEEMKKFHPDAYAFCTPYHKEDTFSNVPSYGEVLEFPIEKNFRTDEEKVLSQTSLGLDPNKVHVINVGLWTSGKNQKEGVEIARLVEKSNPEIQFHFIGNQAPNFKEYWDPIMKNLPSNVKVWGERSDVSTFMKASDIFMFNSTWECNPLVLREAASFGLKILARNLPQYMDMFTKLITPIDEDINKTKDSLLSLVNEERQYDVAEGQNKKFADDHISLYKKVNTFTIKDQPRIKNNLHITQYFVLNPFFEIKGEANDNLYKVEFLDEQGVVHYSNKLRINSWVKLNREYFTRWRTKVWENDELIYDNVLNFKGKRVFISFDSSSLGDSIAWIPYVEEFRKTHDCHVIVSTFKNELFENIYPHLEFVKPGSVVNNIVAQYKIGWFYNKDKQPTDPNIIPLQQTASDILGLPFKEIHSPIHFVPQERPFENKYIGIATQSTSGLKYWTRPNGWETLIEYLKSEGYDIVYLSKEKSDLKGIKRLKDYGMESTMNAIHHAEFIIGLSSGLSWLAWGLGKHVVMISNFTAPDHEFISNCTRIINHDVCNSCWNKPGVKLDKGDWWWCPEHKNTPRHFECHKQITPEMIIEKIKPLIK